MLVNNMNAHTIVNLPRWVWFLGITSSAVLWGLGFSAFLRIPGETGLEELPASWLAALLVLPLLATICFERIRYPRPDTAAGRIWLRVAGLVVVALWSGLLLLWTGVAGHCFK